MNKNMRISLALTSAMVFSSLAGALAYADINIDGQVYTDAWIAAHAPEVADYINKNPAAAAAVLQGASAPTQQVVLNAYNQAVGGTMSLNQAQQWMNQAAAPQATPAGTVTIDGQMYTNAWITAHPTEVANYITANPSTAASILQNASTYTKQAVLAAYNKATGNNMIMQDVDQWIAKMTASNNSTAIVVNGQIYTDDWMAAHPMDVARYIIANPGTAATVLKNASTGTKQIVLTAYNRATGANINMQDADKWINQNATTVNTGTHPTVSGKDRNGQYSNVDIDFLALTMKNGTFDTSNFFVKGYANALGFTDEQVKDFQQFVASHTAAQVADQLATFSRETILKLDEMRPKSSSSVGIAWRVDPWYLSRGLSESPEAWQNVLEYAGIPFSKADLDKFYRMLQSEKVGWLASLSNPQFEKVQAYFYNGNQTATNIPFFATGWDDKTAYDPEIGRVVSPAEKSAIARIKFVAINSGLAKDGGHGEFSTLGESKRQDGMWKPDAFKEYLTEAAIKDYVDNPQKGQFTGGTNGVVTWNNGNGGTASATGTNTPLVTTYTPPTTTTPTRATTTTPATPVKVNSNTDVQIATTVPGTSINNPYAASLSAAAQVRLNAWIGNNITAKSSTLSPTNYSKFIDSTIEKLKAIKKTTSNRNKILVINYLVFELQEIQAQADDSESFLDSLFN